MTEMYFSFSTFVMFLACFSLGIFVLVKNSHDISHRTFFLLNMGISQWSSFYFLMLIAKDHDTALWAARWLHLGAGYIPVFFVHFVLSFLGIVNLRRKILFLEYLIVTAIALFIPTPYFVEDVLPKLYFRYWPEPGFIYPLYLISFFGITLHGHWEMIHRYKQADIIQKMQIKYIILAFIVGFSCGSTTYPLFYDIPIAPIGTPFVVLTPFIIYYAILRHRLLGIDMFLKMTAVFVLFAFLVIYPSFFVVRGLLELELSKNMISGILVCLCLGLSLLLIKLKLRAELTIEQLLFKKRLNFKKILLELSNSLVTKLKLEEIGEAVVRALAKDVDFKFASLIVFHMGEDQKLYLRIFSSNGGLHFNKWESILDNPFRSALGHLNKTYIRKESTLGLISDFDKYMTRKLDEIGVKICMPLMGRNELHGVFFCGKQGVDHIYTESDIDLFEQLRFQLSSAIENANAYQIISDLNVNLAMKVEERTKELEKTLVELKDTQAQLLHSAKLASVGELAAGVAHELNNALNSAVLGNMHLNELLGKSHEKIEVDRFLKEAKEDVRLLSNGMSRAHQVVKNLLTFSKKNSEGFHDQDIHEGIESSLQIMNNELKKRVTVHKEFCEVKKVFCDLSQLNQVFVNIFKNAAEAIREKGNIWVRTWREGRDLCISIRDDGVGIPKENMDKIFDPFFTTKEVGKGTGLGLSVSYNIVRNHSGRIDCQSEPAKGTEFVIKLPVTPAKGVKEDGRAYPKAI